MKKPTIPVSSLVSQFRTLNEALRRPTAEATLLTLKLAKIADTAQTVLAPTDRDVFLTDTSVTPLKFKALACVGKAYGWLQPHHKSLPSELFTLYKIAQRLDATTLPVFIDSGVVSSWMSIHDAMTLPTKYPQRRKLHMPAKKLTYTVLLTFDPATLDAPAVRAFVQRLERGLTGKVTMTVSDDLDTLFKLHAPEPVTR